MAWDEKRKESIAVEEQVRREREEKGAEKVVEDRERIKELLDF